MRSLELDMFHPDCPDDEMIAALAAGELAGERRRDVVAHVATCSDCRAAVASLARVFADPAVAQARSEAARAGRRGLGRLAVPGAAAAAILLVVVLARPSGNTPQEPVHRGPEAPAAVGPRPISPVGAVGHPDRLRWHAVGGADRYRVTLYQPDGRTLYQLELPDTIAPLPDSVPLTASDTYRWKVEARTGWDRWTASELARFTVTEDSAP